MEAVRTTPKYMAQDWVSKAVGIDGTHHSSECQFPGRPFSSYHALEASRCFLQALFCFEDTPLSREGKEQSVIAALLQQKELPWRSWDKSLVVEEQERGLRRPTTSAQVRNPDPRLLPGAWVLLVGSQDQQHRQALGLLERQTQLSQNLHFHQSPGDSYTG